MGMFKQMKDVKETLAAAPEMVEQAQEMAANARMQSNLSRSVCVDPGGFEPLTSWLPALDGQSVSCLQDARIRSVWTPVEAPAVVQCLSTGQLP